MGIDVYLNWPKQTKADKENQYTGYKIDQGKVGYLREAYHGGPYATRVLIPEGWDDDIERGKGGVPIPAATLRERMPQTVLTAIYRNHIVYEQGSDPSLIDLSKDADVATVLANLITSFKPKFSKGDEVDIAKHFNVEQVRAITEVISKRALPDYALAFVDFVELAEAKEKQTGKSCSVYVSR